MTPPEIEGYEPDEEDQPPQSNELEVLALKIAQGPITAETLTPLLNALVLEERRKELDRQEILGDHASKITIKESKRSRSGFSVYESRITFSALQRYFKTRFRKTFPQPASS